ncbi:mechanosensitive ion channel [Alistipes sp. OttesenSCG-928-B03]|nr:mechanosensitive ion channel [Alistipes sp. OttesenSCG-928-B03]
MLLLQISNADAQQLAEKMDSTTMAKLSTFWTTLKTSPEDALSALAINALKFGAKLLLAVVVFYIGRWIIRRIRKMLNHMLERRKADTSLQTFLNHLVNIICYIFLFVIIIHIFGLPTTGFVAIFTALALAIGMALSGTLSNFAGGVLILLLKPYHIGDYVEMQGYGGTVRKIQLFNTIITTSDNKTVLIPNGPISTGSVNNFSKQNTRRVEWIVGIAYGDDFDQARKIINDILLADPRILDKPAYTIEINELGTSSVNILIRVWVRSDDYWNVYFAVNKELYNRLPANGIQFPYSQMDVHITQIDTVAAQPATTARVDEKTNKA